MEQVTFALAILLAAGFIAAKIGQLIQLPSVTGYILAGLILGPTGIGLITENILGDKLTHFITIALMLISFGIGEHLELKKLKSIIKSIGIISIGETFFSFLLVGLVVFFFSVFTNIGDTDWTYTNYHILALLLAVISMATAPATSLHIMRELKARGPLTTTLMAVIAIDNGLAIIFFGISVSMAHHILGSLNGSFLTAILSGIIEIVSSLLLGIIAGFIIDIVVKKLKNRSEMLTVGLALLLLCGEIARILHYSPLLAGMAAGFTIINRDRRDVRIFKTLNTFEPPIYVLFFTLAGTQLHFSALKTAGVLGLLYFFMRGTGKITGAFIGSKIAKAPKTVQKYLGTALIPQAGVAIGLIFLIKNDSTLKSYSEIIIPVVLAGVVLSELFGPICSKYSFLKSGEAAQGNATSKIKDLENITDKKQIQMTPWKSDKIKIDINNTDESVLFRLLHPETAPPLTRIALLLSKFYKSKPLATYILSDDTSENIKNDYIRLHKLFGLAKKEAETLGTDFSVETINSEKISKGIIKCAINNNSRCILLGYHLNKNVIDYSIFVESIVEEVQCPVIVAKFSPTFNTEKILVPITKIEDLSFVQNVIMTFADDNNHKITILKLLPPDQPKEKINKLKQKIKKWISSRGLIDNKIKIQIATSETLLESIIDESDHHDLIVMTTTDNLGFQRFFFGSLCYDVAKNINKSMLIVYNPRVGNISYNV